MDFYQYGLFLEIIFYIWFLSPVFALISYVVTWLAKIHNHRIYKVFVGLSILFTVLSVLLYYYLEVTDIHYSDHYD